MAESPVMCLQWNLGHNNDMTGVTVEEQEYKFVIDPPLMQDGTYHETIEAVTTDPAEGLGYKLLCIKRVKYLSNLNLPVWETRIPHTCLGVDHGLNGRRTSIGDAVSFACPLNGGGP
jgi:hypothetical protein